MSLEFQGQLMPQPQHSIILDTLQELVRPGRAGCGRSKVCVGSLNFLADQVFSHSDPLERAVLSFNLESADLINHDTSRSWVGRA